MEFWRKRVRPHTHFGVMTSQFPDPLVVVVSREEVLRCDPAPAVGVLTRFVETATHPAQVRGRVVLAFHGYDLDGRELWQIGEVRKYVAALDDLFPFWFWVVDLRSELLKILAFCLCRSTVAAAGATLIHQGDFTAFLERHFGAMNQLLDHWQLSDEENRHVTEEIVEHFSQASIIN